MSCWQSAELGALGLERVCEPKLIPGFAKANSGRLSVPGAKPGKRSLPLLDVHGAHISYIVLIWATVRQADALAFGLSQEREERSG